MGAQAAVGALVAQRELHLERARAAAPQRGARRLDGHGRLQAVHRGQQAQARGLHGQLQQAVHRHAAREFLRDRVLQLLQRHGVAGLPARRLAPRQRGGGGQGGFEDEASAALLHADWPARRRYRPTTDQPACWLVRSFSYSQAVPQRSHT